MFPKERNTSDKVATLNQSLHRFVDDDASIFSAQLNSLGMSTTQVNLGNLLVRGRRELELAERNPHSVIGVLFNSFSDPQFHGENAYDILSPAIALRDLLIDAKSPETAATRLSIFFRELHRLGQGRVATLGIGNHPLLGITDQNWSDYITSLSTTADNLQAGIGISAADYLQMIATYRQRFGIEHILLAVTTTLDTLGIPPSLPSPRTAPEPETRYGQCPGCGNGENHSICEYCGSVKPKID